MGWLGPHSQHVLGQDLHPPRRTAERSRLRRDRDNGQGPHLRRFHQKKPGTLGQALAVAFSSFSATMHSAFSGYMWGLPFSDHSNFRYESQVATTVQRWGANQEDREVGAGPFELATNGAFSQGAGLGPWNWVASGAGASGCSPWLCSGSISAEGRRLQNAMYGASSVSPNGGCSETISRDLQIIT